MRPLKISTLVFAVCLALAGSAGALTLHQARRADRIHQARWLHRQAREVRAAIGSIDVGRCWWKLRGRVAVCANWTENPVALYNGETPFVYSWTDIVDLEGNLSTGGTLSVHSYGGGGFTIRMTA